MANNEEVKEIRLYAEEIDRRLKLIEEAKEEVKAEIEEFEVIKFYSNLKVGKLYASFPIVTSTPSNVGLDGETILYDNGTTRKIMSYLSSSWRSSTLT